MTKPGIKRVVELEQLLLQFRAIKRTLYSPNDPTAQENNAEHTYDLTMTAWFLSQHFPELDQNKIIRMALAHDLVEVHTGDTEAFGDKQRKASKQEREAAAAEQLTKDWSDFPDMLTAITEYEARKAPEARFVYALDKLMPPIINLLADGYGWHKHNVTLEDFAAEKEPKVSVSPEILPYYRELFDLIRSNPGLMPPSKQR